MASNQNGGGQHGGGQNSGGRNPQPDEHRPSWRPQDPNIRSRGGEEDQSHDDREQRQTDSFGQGQSGYGSGRAGGDRSMRFQNRNEGYSPGAYEDRPRQAMGVDDRFASGRGGGDYWQDRQDRQHEDVRDRDEVHDQYSERVGYQGQGAGRDQRQTGYSAFKGGGTGGAQFTNMGGQYPQNPSRPVQPGLHGGKGPQGYMRSDDRIRELVCEALTDDPHIDATHIEVVVKNGDVMLTGTVEDRQQKRAVEDVIERCPGVKDIQNGLRVQSQSDRNRGNQSAESMVGKNETDVSSERDRDRKPRA